MLFWDKNQPDDEEEEQFNGEEQEEVDGEEYENGSENEMVTMVTSENEMAWIVTNRPWTVPLRWAQTRQQTLRNRS